MIVVAGTINVKPDRVAEAIQAASEMAATSRDEPGCGAYRFGVDVDDPHRLHLFEEWADQSALDLHFGTAHFAAFSTVLVEVMTDGSAFTRYEVASSGPLFG